MSLKHSSPGGGVGVGGTLSASPSSPYRRLLHPLHPVLVLCPTEYTELQPLLSGVHSVMRVKLALAGEGGGAGPPPLIIFTITSKVAVYAPAEWADTLTLFHLYQCTLCSVPSPISQACTVLNSSHPHVCRCSLLGTQNHSLLWVCLCLDSACPHP
jgi:hypothetical protein